MKYTNNQISEMKEAIIASGYDLNQLLVYKCESCKQILFTRSLSDPIYNTGSQAFKYVTLKHMRKCDNSNVIVYGAEDKIVNLSEELKPMLEKWVGSYNKTYSQVLDRSIYNAAGLLTAQEYNELVDEKDQQILDEVSEREDLPRLIGGK